MWGVRGKPGRSLKYSRVPWERHPASVFEDIRAMSVCPEPLPTIHTVMDSLRWHSQFRRRMARMPKTNNTRLPGSGTASVVGGVPAFQLLST